MSAATSAARPGRKLPWNTIGLYLGIAAMAFFCLAPFYWMLVSSLKDPAAIFDNALVPAAPTLMNYGAVFGAQNTFVLALRNSLIIAGSVTVVALVFGVFASYAIARLEFRGKTFVLGLFLATSMFPGVAILTPLFQLFADLGWIDTFQAMIIPDISFSLPLGVWILTSFFRAMPWELEQAALVDGCTPVQAFRRIILPLAVPGVFTTAILVFISAWNEFMIANSMSQTPASQPVTVAIAQFSGISQYDTPYGTQMAAGVIVTVPLIILVLIFQRRIISGLTAGGVKVASDIALFAGRTAQYVFVSSASAYQTPPARLPVTESTPLRNPFWAYSRHKIACEDVLVAAYRETGFPVTIVRPSHTPTTRPWCRSTAAGRWSTGCCAARAWWCPVTAPRCGRSPTTPTWRAASSVSSDATSRSVRRSTSPATRRRPGTTSTPRSPAPPESTIPTWCMCRPTRSPPLTPSGVRPCSGTSRTR